MVLDIIKQNGFQIITESYCKPAIAIMLTNLSAATLIYLELKWGLEPLYDYIRNPNQYIATRKLINAFSEEREEDPVVNNLRLSEIECISREVARNIDRFKIK